MNSPSALRVIDSLAVEFGDDMMIGAGTVLDPESARAALLAGARYIFSPTLDLRTIEMTKRYGAVSIPGAFTPSEILAAFQAGADLIQVFPATVLGPGYIRDIHGPLPQIPLMPTGGIDETNVASYIKAGAAAVGLGSHLVNSKAEVTDAYLTELAQKAKQFIQRVHKARGE